MSEEQDTAALVETVRRGLMLGTDVAVTEAAAAVRTLAQRLAEAEYRRTAESMDRIAAEARAERAEEALREIASCKDHEVLPATSMTPEVNVTHLCPGVARRALTPTEEPESR